MASVITPSTGTNARQGILAAASLTRSANSPAVYNHVTATVVNNTQVPLPYVDDRYFIVSIYPQPMAYQLRQGDVRNGGRGVTNYLLHAAKRGQYQILEIAPTIAWRQNFEDGYDQAPHGMVPMVTSAEANAKALVSLWTSGVRVGTGKPGIALLPFGVMEDTPEFYEFMGKMVEQQELYFSAIVEEAQAAFMRGDKIQALDQAVAAVFWLQGDQAEQYEWVGRKKFTMTKPCPACTKPIGVAAIKCTECNTELLKFYAEYNASAQDADDVVYLYQLMLKEGKFPTGSMVDRVMANEDPELVAAAALEAMSAKKQAPASKK